MSDNDHEFIEAKLEEFEQTSKQHQISSAKELQKRARVHCSMYLERDSYDRLNKAYKMTCHKLYPHEVLKSTFTEACIAYALEHLPDIEDILTSDKQQHRHR